MFKGSGGSSIIEKRHSKTTKHGVVERVQGLNHSDRGGGGEGVV